jgi:hypothetical protein
VISQYFSKNAYLNELFEVIRVDESCYPLTAWRGDNTNFALWTNKDEEVQRQFCKGVQEKIKQADIFVFQSTSRSTIEELRTDYLCENISTGKNVCIPNMRVFVYCNDGASLLPYIEYAKSKVKNPDDTEEIYNFLQTSDDPKLTKILEQNYPISTIRIKKRNENHQRAKKDSEEYPNYICMENFIKENFKSKLLFCSHNHPTTTYFIELLKLLLINLGLNDFNIEEKDIQKLGGYKIDPMQFKFFKEYFPLLNQNL